MFGIWSDNNEKKISKKHHLWCIMKNTQDSDPAIFYESKYFWRSCQFKLVRIFDKIKCTSSVPSLQPENEVKIGDKTIRTGTDHIGFTHIL